MRFLFLPAAISLALITGCASTTAPNQPSASAPAAVPVPPTPPVVPTPDATPATAGTSDLARTIAGFHAWLRSFAQEARAAGISQQTVDATLAQARWQPRVVELDRAQPEFTRTPWAYLDSAGSPQRVAQGREQRRLHAAALDVAEQRHGVPAGIITAIWGMESNYGGNFGSFSAVDALATLAYDGRRRDWARGELLAALRIVDRGDIAADALVGSWAGAMGHTQFLPSVYLAHAVDADGDGRRDIWGSVPDVLASTANFLAHSGWQAGQPWGVEVRLPPGFDYARTELNVRQDSQAWALDGVRAVDGQPLPALPNAAIVTPAGASGPAILVGPNFGALLRYNNSVNYALAVGLLARQIDGGDGLLMPWPRDLPALSRGEIKVLQQALNDRGFGAGAVDGVLGPATRAGVRRLQQSLGLPADGFATPQLLERLQAP